jgi:murein L,D-transpeptidase YcbB/YkuD
MEGPPGETVDLASPVPVHLVYFTAIARDDGVLEFRHDAYGWDLRLHAALSGSAPE